MAMAMEMEPVVASASDSILQQRPAMTTSTALQSVRECMAKVLLDVNSEQEQEKHLQERHQREHRLQDPLSLLPMAEHMHRVDDRGLIPFALQQDNDENIGLPHFHPLSEAGAVLDQKWRHCRQQIGFIRDAMLQHKARLEAQRVAEPKLVSVLAEKNKHWNRLHQVQDGFQMCTKALTAQRRLDIARRDGHERLELLLIDMENICLRLGLWCDVEVKEERRRRRRRRTTPLSGETGPERSPTSTPSTPSLSSSPATKSVTIQVGSIGELTCFAVEIKACSPPASGTASSSSSCVYAVQTTFVFGDDETNSAEIDADLLGLLQGGDYRGIEAQLRNALAMEKHVETIADKSLLDVRHRIRNAFTSAGADVRERFDGPSTAFFSAPVDVLVPLHPDSQRRFCLSFVGVHQPIDNLSQQQQQQQQGLPLRYLFEVSPPLPTSRNVASALFRCDANVGAAETDPAYDCSLRTLLRCDQPGLLEFRHQRMRVSAATLEDRGVVVSRVFVEHLDRLSTLLPILRQQAVFNTLMQSCFRAIDPELGSTGDVATLDVAGESPFLVQLSTISDDDLVSIRVQVKAGGELNASVRSERRGKALCSAEYATAVLTRSMSLPLLVHYLRTAGKVAF